MKLMRPANAWAMTSLAGLLRSGPLAPKPEIVAKLNAELNKALASQEMKDLFAKEGAEGAPMSVAEFSKTVESEINNWKRVAQQAKIKAE